MLPEGTAAFDLSSRSKLLFEGPQALWFLDQLITNKVDELKAGEAVEALLLTPKGKIISVLRVLVTGDGAFVEAGPGEAEDLMEFFSGRVFSTKVTISDVTNDFKILRIVNASSITEVEAASRVFPGPAENWFDIWTSAESSGSGSTVGDVVLLTASEYEDLRVSAGVPLFGVDIDETFLPQEAAFEKGVHFSKGCYLGQEAVAMAQRGRIKRRLRHLHFEGEPRLGEIQYEGSGAGRATSIGSVEGRGFGIATVKSVALPGTRVQVIGEGGESFAEVAELPGTTEGPKVPSARELRERLTGG